MSRAAHVFRRKLNELEEAALAGGGAGPPSEADVRAALEPLVPPAPDEAAAARERVEALAGVAAGRRPAGAYRELHGTCGIRRYTTAGGRVITLMPIETYPDHVNNVYLVRDRDHRFLFDAGSLIASSQDDFARAARVLRAVYGEPEPFADVRDVIVSHGHTDHFAGVGVWRERGARVHVHELDARVVGAFEERIVVTARAVRQFFQAAGVAEEERRELEGMYVFTKNMYRSVPVDRILSDGAVVCGAVAHHAAGHCPGQICLQVDDVLLSADHVLPRITPHQSPESIMPSTGLDHYFESLEKIRRVGGIDLALPGHEEPIPRLHQRIAEILSFHEGRLAKVQEACAGEPRTVKQMSDTLFGRQKGYARILALQETGAHVEYLARRGRLLIANLQDFNTELNPVVFYRASSQAE